MATDAGTTATRYSLRSAVGILLLDAVGKTFAFGANLLLIRFMPAAAYADLAIASSLRTLLNGTFAASFNRIYLIGCSSLGLRDSAASFLMVQFALVVTAGLVAFPLLPGLRWMFPLILTWSLAQVAYDFARTSFQQRLEFRQFSRFELVRSASLAALLIPLVLLLRESTSAWTVVIVQSVALLLAILVLAPREARRWIEEKKDQFVPQLKLLIRSDYLYLFFYTVVLTLISQTDVMVLKALEDVEVLATYASAYQYYGLLILALSAVGSVIAPTMQVLTTRAEIDLIFRKHRRLVWWAIPAFLAGTWLAGLMLPWVDQGKYPEAVLTFRLLGASAFLSLVFSPHAAFVARFEDFRFLFWTALGVLGMCVPLQIWCASHYGSVGSAAGLLITYLALNGTLYLRTKVLLTRFAG